MKECTFRFLNSFIGIFYAAFFDENRDILNTSKTLITLLSSKSASDYLMRIRAKEIKFNIQKFFYFRKVKNLS